MLYEQKLARNLSCDGAPHFGLCVFEKFDKCRDEVSVDNFLVNSFSDLYHVSLDPVSLANLTDFLKSISDHVSHPPALIFKQTTQSREEHTMARLLLFRHCFCDGNKDVYRQKPNTILIVCGKMLEQ